ncbi:DNA polymerase III subunit tau [Aquisphaera giovannonii]|uniref:DNA polymerase III subunit gamma/tau n=1 Tax=Aquisphaera giovannonii TaxID=406548 RepID=A0A5B9W492_9BACT|nr:DNA polymerase III subunit gamma/tau [Aquisphaera giovannonii]QEH35067.1 DNA polymerase III subunit tau [Aquisphaera giovannonii]
MTPGTGSKRRSAEETPAEDDAPALATADGRDGPPSAPEGGDGYTVVARRYRPQRLEDVVGQDHVVQALRNAIRLKRLAQAYLFCGTRGVGKTSMARIFAKCLNCVKGPTEEPCQVCEICRDIAAGQDMDVIEIDGASNNGVEQVRELRQNASLRPSRARFKIYYIDEVHMLSTGAFNALLKTLEEPPPHVKFFFATTEANKIPITVLSRCQKYDFAGITPDDIVASLRDICRRERMDAEPEALQVVARRAGGSMRDAQSLLEQLLASGSPKLTVEVVHRLLGTPSDERLLGVLEALAGRDAAKALSLLDEAASQGVEPVDLLSGVLDFLRDALVLSVGAGSVLLAVTPRQKPRLQAIVEAWTTDAILAALQILAEARARMRGTPYGRLLVEMAMVRVARLENLSELGDLVRRLADIEAGVPVPPRPAAPVEKKKQSDAALSHEPAVAPRVEPAPARSADPPPAPPARPERAAAEPPPRPADAPPARPSPPPPAPREAESRPSPAAKGPASRNSGPPLDLKAMKEAWPEVVKKVGAGLGLKLVATEPVAVQGADVLVFGLKSGYNRSFADHCGTPDAIAKIELALQRMFHRAIAARYDPAVGADGPGEGRPAAAEARRPEVLAGDPIVQRMVELFEARPLHLEYEEEPRPGANPDPN